MQIIIDQHSGFCFGVVSAIRSAEKELQDTDQLYCLGDIVHNGEEVKRLSEKGLKVISHQEFDKLGNETVLIRAHGEPPQTYDTAKNRNIKLIDATCPIVLKLQEKIKHGYTEMQAANGQVVIFGSKGHAEVVGLQGQTKNTAIVISSLDDLHLIDFSKPIRLYSQTTKNKEEYLQIIEEIKNRINPEAADFVSFNTICGQVANRSDDLKNFSKTVDVLVFVSGKNSSNGKYLFGLCKSVQQHSYFISHPDELEKNWFCNAQKVGIAGATSTPMWLMQQVAETIEKFDSSKQISPCF